MTTEQGIKLHAMREAIDEAEDYINDLYSKVEDLETENQRLRDKITDLKEERDSLVTDLNNCEDQMGGG